MTEQPGFSSSRNLMVGEHRVEIEPSPRWLRAVFNGETVASSKRVLLLRETASLPIYYFPSADVRSDLLEPSTERTRDAYKGEATYFNVRVGDRRADDSAWCYHSPLPAADPIKGHFAFVWRMMDAWYEEEEEVFVHARDPYKRIDTMPSSRHVKVVVGGQTIAETRGPHLLFETGLPTRYYIPREDVRIDLLEATETRSRCPYKGEAIYWHPIVGDSQERDIVWSYPEPIAECPKIRGLMAFFNERVDALYVDGELQPRPKTNWS